MDMKLYIGGKDIHSIIMCKCNRQTIIRVSVSKGTGRYINNALLYNVQVIKYTARGSEMRNLAILFIYVREK